MVVPGFRSVRLRFRWYSAALAAICKLILLPLLLYPLPVTPGPGRGRGEGVGRGFSSSSLAGKSVDHERAVAIARASYDAVVGPSALSKSAGGIIEDVPHLAVHWQFGIRIFQVFG